MKFIGRRRELESLETAYQTDGGFVVIYGRRRVGKTTLIKEFIKDKLAFYFLATEEVESQSMKRLASVAARIMKNPMLQRVAFSDWLDLFRVISEYRPEEMSSRIWSNRIRRSPPFSKTHGTRSSRTVM